MGMDIRQGIGYGMTEAEARRDYKDRLNQAYGDDVYSGGGNSIVGWLDSKCEVEPVKASSANKAKKLKVSPRTGGKLVNGFRITNDTPELMRKQFFAQHNGMKAPEVVEAFTLTAAEANKKAMEMALKHNSKVQVIPARLWQEEGSLRLSLPQQVLEFVPDGGKEPQPGKWRFKVEVRV